MVEGGGVFVSASIHETALEVDENGTRASAFTGFGLRKMLLPFRGSWCWTVPSSV